MNNPNREFGSTPRVRPEIQGLRAIAVLAVVLFHANLPGLPGGFVGVDIFFVISGYLICGLLNRELGNTGRIDLIAFWLRRSRRLLPNACLTLLAVLLATALLRPHFTFQAVAQDVTAAALYVANLRFAVNNTDYFADTAHPSPVLHFWSLSVEEQFYIVWPLLLTVTVWLTGRRALRTMPWLIGAVWIASFAASIVAVRAHQPVAFYHGEMRAWQLATGGLLALLEQRASILTPLARSLAAWLGLAGLVASLLVLNEQLIYPGYWALLPTLATALVLAGTREAAGWSPAWLLGVAPLRWIGDRSYSFYLWHWPALVLSASVFPKIGLNTPIALVVATVLAMASYRWVEMPLRHGTLRFNVRWPEFAMAAAAIVTVLAGSSILAKAPWHRGSAILALDQSLHRAATERGRNFIEHCHLKYEQTDQPLCAFGDVGASRTAVLFGDSHASQWFEAIDKVAKARGWRLLAWTKSSCPAADVPTWQQSKHRPFTACALWRSNVLKRLTGSERPQLAIVASFVASAGGIWDRDTGTILPRAYGNVLWRNGLAATIRRLQNAGIEAVVIADNPQADPQFADCLATWGGSWCNRARREAVPQIRPDVEAAQLTGARVVDLTDRICDGEVCPAMRDGMIVYRDRSHLTTRFATSLSDGFLAVLPPPPDQADDMVVGSISTLRATSP